MSDDFEITALLQRLVDDEPPFLTALGPALTAAEIGGLRRRRRRTVVRTAAFAVPVLAVVALLGLVRPGADRPVTPAKVSLPDVAHRIAAPAGGTVQVLDAGSVRTDDDHGALTISTSLNALPALGDLEERCRRQPTSDSADQRTCRRSYLLARQGLWHWDWTAEAAKDPTRRVGEEVIAAAQLPNGDLLLVSITAPPRRTVSGAGITDATVRETLARYSG